MRLTEYITANMETLVREWESFARSVQPLPAHMSNEELRDWAGQTLEAIAADLDVPQTDAEESLRSKGVGPTHERLSDCGYEHAAERLMHGFTLEQVTAEFRALRASVFRSCIRATAEQDRAALVPQLFRFDQALDEAFAASMREYTRRLERARLLVLGALGHDLRSPLSAISTGVEYLLISGENLSHEQTKTLIRLRSSVDRMTKMIADILDFTRTRLGGSLPILRDDMDLAETLRLVIDELRSYHPGRVLTLNTSGDLRGTWDRTRIEQVATNLISNALQYSPPGSPVTVVARDAGEEVTFSVHNLGQPIPHEARLVLFDPLVRGGPEARSRRSRQNGVGLGLYIAKRIAEAHSGRIELDSSEEAGTTFKVALPRRRAIPREESHL